MSHGPVTMGSGMDHAFKVQRERQTPQLKPMEGSPYQSPRWDEIPSRAKRRQMGTLSSRFL